MSSEIDDIDNELVLTAEKLQEVKLCVNSKEGIQQSLLGLTLGGGLTGLVFSLPGFHISKGSKATLACIGAIYGFGVAKFFRTRDCIAKVLKLPNNVLYNKGITRGPPKKEIEDMYIYKRSRPQDENLIKPEVLAESTKETTIFDMDTSPRMDLLDDFPTITENAKDDALEITAPKRSVTYKELRQKNRESFRSKHPIQKPIWSHDEDKAQTEELENGPLEFDPSSQPSIGKHRTKYGDVWD